MMADAAPRRARPLPRGLAREAIAFYAGLLAVLLALVSPLAYWSRDFIWVRSLQDLLLAVVAPPLIVLGAPWLALRRGLGRPAAAGGVLAAAARAAAAAAPVAQAAAAAALTWPVAVTAAFTVVWCGWHVPVAVRRRAAPPGGPGRRGRQLPGRRVCCSGCSSSAPGR